MPRMTGMRWCCCVGRWWRHHHRRRLVRHQQQRPVSTSGASSSSSSPFAASYGLWVDDQEVVSLSPPTTCMEARGLCIASARSTDLDPRRLCCRCWIDSKPSTHQSSHHRFTKNQVPSSPRVLLRSPATREPLTEIPSAGTSDVDRAVGSGAASFEEGTWARGMDGRTRSKVHFIQTQRPGPITLFTCT